MTKLYQHYWGKAEHDPLKAAYCTGQLSKQAILEQFKPELAAHLNHNKPASQLQVDDLDTWAATEQPGKQPWHYQQQGYAAYHLLAYHCLDVAAVAAVWWDASPSLRKQFSHIIQAQSEQQAKAWVLFFVALHDLGKLDIRFQLKAKAVAIQLQA
ncbi:MAG: CRISPR-associated endonuclease Cas3'', partial [Methylococcaceae bacterium]|nr:CRISPR-associated endonuclease Cas3'' [Methylococcaceae bacterium]